MLGLSYVYTLMFNDFVIWFHKSVSMWSDVFGYFKVISFIINDFDLKPR